jgi:hypothetical protein
MTRIALFVTALFAWSFAAPARAAEEEAAKVRVTSFMLSHKDLDEGALAPAMHALDDALRRNPRLEMKDLETRLADFAQEIPSDQVDEGRKNLEEGEKAITAHQLPAALKSLRSAVEILSRVLPFIKKQELAESMVALGVAECESGDKRACRTQFMRLLIWRNDEKYDLAKFSNKYLGLFEEVRKELEKSHRGSLEIHSDPPAAQAYVDGRYIGVTPTFAEGLIAGEHFVTLKRDGYKKTVEAATVSGKVQETTEIKMEREAKFLLVEDALRAVERQAGRDQLDSDVDNLKEVLFIDHAVFVRTQRSSPGHVRVESFLYDLRSHRRLASDTRDIANKDLVTAFAKIPSALYLNVRYDADLQAPADEPVPVAKAPPKPVYKRWWFWTVVGVAAVGVGITAGVLAEKYRPVNCNTADNSCVGFSF